MAERKDIVSLRLTIDIVYETGRTSVETLKRQLVSAADHLADNGLLSGDTEASVETWNSTVTERSV